MYPVEPLESRISPAVVVALDLSRLNGGDGFKIQGEAEFDASGSSVSSAGDVNADGFLDFIIGAPYAASIGDSYGASYVIFGKTGEFRPSFDLASLDGSNGFKIAGSLAGDFSPSSVSSAGDVNGDGFADLLIGARYAGSSGAVSGASYVIFGMAASFPPVLGASSLQGSNGFKIQGEAAGDYVGGSVSSAGDINADGYSDVIIGAIGADPNGTSSGASYLIFGTAEAFPPVLNLSSLDGSNGFKIEGEREGDQLGSSVSGAGDVNGDGFADLLIGARFGGNDAGLTYVIFGRAKGFTRLLNVASLNGSDGFKIQGESEFGLAGESVSSAGDVNGDGFSDVLIGAPGSFPGSDFGASYLVFGKPDRFGPVFQLSDLNGINGFKIRAESKGDYAGTSVSSAGDFNGDGFSDLLIGASGADPSGSDSGAGYVIFGKAERFTAVVQLSSLDGNNGFRIQGESKRGYAGSTVSSAGDVNGDGFSDLLIGAPSRSNDSGASYLIFGMGNFMVGSFTERTRSVSFTEPDGDLVTIGLSKGKIARERITLTIAEGGLFLSHLELSGRGANKGASVIIAAETGEADVGLVTIGVGARVSELRVQGDLTALRAVSEMGRDKNFDPIVLPGGNVDLVHANSLGLKQEHFPGLKPEVAFGSRAVRVEVNADVSGMSVQLERGAVRLEVGGDWLNSDLHTEARLQLLEIAGSIRDSFIGGVGSRRSRSAAATTLFGSVNIGGDFDHSQLLAGFDDTKTAAGGASIRQVLIKGRFLASNIVAGATPGEDLVFGTSDDLAIADKDRFLSKIGEVTLLGLAVGSENDAASFGIVAEEVGKVSLAGELVTLIRGAGNDTAPRPIDKVGEVQIREVKASIVVRLNLSSLDGGNGFKIQGAAELDRVGSSVSSAGDVNGDGFADLLIGARGSSPNGDASGASYVVFGGSEGHFPRALNLSSLDGINGFKIQGEAEGDYAGVSVSGVGDVNGDGCSDLLIGATQSYADVLGAGGAYVVFGREGAFMPVLNLSSLDGGNGFKISGVAAGDITGSSVSGAGDVNQDGIFDIIIGAPGVNANGASSGASYVIFGKRGAFTPILNLSNLDGSNGFKINGEAAYDAAGTSVSAAGDVNGDGFSDVIIGAPLANANGRFSGASYIVFGKGETFVPVLNLSSLNGSDGFKVRGQAAGNYAGYSVSGAGDVNGDGFSDLVIGAPRTSPNSYNAGASYVIFGRPGAALPVLDLSSLDGTNGFKINGEEEGDGTGVSVSDAGDVNGDGFSDLLIGANGADPNGSYSGATYVIYGKAGDFTPAINLSVLNGANGFKIQGEEEGDIAGANVSGAGDVNGDGFSDLLIGASLASPNGLFSGATYVVFGTPAVQIDERTIAYTEADGDRVLLQVQSGTITTGSLEFEELGENRYVVRTLDLRSESLRGADVSIQVISSGFGTEPGALGARGTGNMGSTDVGMMELPNEGGPESVNIDGNVNAGNVPAGAKLKTFTVRSLERDSTLFPDIPARFNGAGTLVTVNVKENVSNFEFNVPGSMDQMIVGGLITDSKLSFSDNVKKFSVKGDVTKSSISWDANVGSVLIGGDLSSSLITVKGAIAPPNAAQAIALRKLTVGGDLEWSQILAGYIVDPLNPVDLSRANPDAQIGAVSIAGVLRASSLVAGAMSGADGIFGTADDSLLGSGGAVISRIASITLGGVEGTTASGDGFGIVAEEIGKVRIGSALVSLTKKAGNDLTPIPLLPTNDVFVREVAAGV